MKNQYALGFGVLAVLFSSFGGLAASPPVHPLDSLTEAELNSTVQILKANSSIPPESVFPVIALQEPEKAEVMAYQPGQPFSRKAYVSIYHRPENKTYDAVVDLKVKKVVSLKIIPRAQPLILDSEYKLLSQIITADPRWQIALKKRGITDVSNVFIDAWAVGSFSPKTHKNSRLLRGIPYLKEGTLNFYARPIEGLTALADLNGKKVIELIDTGVVPIPEKTQELDQSSIGLSPCSPKEWPSEMPPRTETPLTPHLTHCITP